jgi:hypothetical protein
MGAKPVSAGVSASTKFSMRITRASSPEGGTSGGGGGGFRKGSMVEQDGLVYKKAAVTVGRRGYGFCLSMSGPFYMFTEANATLEIYKIV